MKRLFTVISMLSIFVLSSLYFLTGCATTGGPKIRLAYELDPSTPSPQTKKGLTIELEYMDEQKSETLGFKHTQMVEGLFGPVPQEVKLDPFWHKKVTGFRVKITNGMDHILRMKDARIALVVAGKRYPALSREEWANMFINPEGQRYFEADLISRGSFPVINDLGIEIYPDPNIPEIGYVAFRLPAEQAIEGTITFYDLTTKVDTAGNPIEKEKFEFKIKQKVIQIPGT